MNAQERSSRLRSQGGARATGLLQDLADLLRVDRCLLVGDQHHRDPVAKDAANAAVLANLPAQRLGGELLQGFPPRPRGLADQAAQFIVIAVKPNGSCRRIEPPSDPYIYHHKWLFVADDYDGFDIEESKARSGAWLALPEVDRTRIGRACYWHTHVVPRLDEQAAKGPAGHGQKA